MKHINESIRDRRGGYTGAPILQEHDIVLTRKSGLYMILKTPEEILAGDLNPNDINKKQGILYRTELYRGLSWLPLKDYDVKTLKLTRDTISHKYDIDRVWRGNYKLSLIYLQSECEILNLKNLIQNQREYHLIWKRK